MDRRADLSPPRSVLLDLDGPVHVADYGADHGADPGRPTVVCVHGLGNSHVSWREMARALGHAYRVLAVDLPGHGRSPRAGRSVGVDAAQGILDRVIAGLTAGPITLVGHSMGATVAMVQAARRPGSVSALALLAPPMPRRPGERMTLALAARVALCTWPWLARTTLGIQARRLGAEEFVRRRLALTCASDDGVDDMLRQSLVDQVQADRAGEAHAAFVEAARSVGWLVARSSDYQAVIGAVHAPTLVVHGAQDRILSHHGLGQLARVQPRWLTEVLEDVGHSPHMEAPRRTAQLLDDFLSGRGRGAASSIVRLRRELGSSVPSVRREVSPR